MYDMRTSTYMKFHRVRVCELEWFIFIDVLGLGQCQWFRLGSAGEFLTADQLDLSTHYPAIGELVLLTTFVVGDDEMNMVGNVCNSILKIEVLW